MLSVRLLLFSSLFVCPPLFFSFTPSFCSCLSVGMEVAAYLSDKAASISCIDVTAVPFERVLGEPVGKMLQEVRSHLTP